MRSRPDSPRRQPNVLARAAGLATTALLAAAVLVGTGAGSAAGWNQGSAEATVWQLLNGARANNGLNVLVQHGTLVSLARWRSADLVQRNYFSHTILGTGYQVYHWYDTNGLAYSLGGENIAWNSGYADADSPVAAHNGFMNSAGHRANILRSGWTHGGVGAYGADNVNFLGSVRSPRTYTQLFMTAAGGAAVGAAAVGEAAAGRRRRGRRRRRFRAATHAGANLATPGGARAGQAGLHRAGGRQQPADPHHRKPAGPHLGRG